MTSTMPETVLQKKPQSMTEKIQALKTRREHLLLGGGADKLGKLTDTQLFSVGCAGSSTCVALGEGHSGSKLTVIGEKSSLPR